MLKMRLDIIIKLVEEVAVMSTMDWDDIEVDDNEVTIDGNTYMVLDEDEIIERMDDHIRETASYFNASFLAGETGLDEEIFENLIDKNEAVYNLIEKTCGIEEFIDSAIRADGAGHFLNSYDGSEIDLIDGYSAFQIS
jgi:hypothetical protein